MGCFVRMSQKMNDKVSEIRRSSGLCMTQYRPVIRVDLKIKMWVAIWGLNSFYVSTNKLRFIRCTLSPMYSD